jgi:protein-S-isoprenylcysteine O-methyltransferase Ste14
MNGLLNIRPNLIIGIFLAFEIIFSFIGALLNWKSLHNSTYTVIIGFIIAILGFIIHTICHISHKQGHRVSSEIDEIVTEGPFKYIRHPMYTGLLLIFWGIYIAWSYVYTLIIPIASTILLYLLAKEEEKYLLENLSNKYKKYKKKVKWMFIPGII